MNLIRAQQLAATTHCQNIDPLFDAIDHSILTDEDLPNTPGTDLGNNAPAPRKLD